MKRALLLLILLAPTASAALPPLPTGVCAQPGCIRAQDSDGDGAIDWASASFTVGEQITINVVRDGDDVIWQADATSHELAEEPLLTISAAGGVDSGACGVERADALLYVSQGDHETGEETTIVREYIALP